MEWMVWTPSVAIFISVILVSLAGLTVWELKSPTIERKGFLPIMTTRGDRFFIGLLGAAFVNLFWIGLTDMSAWFGFVLSLIYMAVIARWG